MKILKCGKCGAQFDVAAMKAGSTFACGKCRATLSVPAEAPPATVAMSADQMKKAIDEARSGGAVQAAAPAAKAQPKLPPAMQARAQSSAGAARATGAAPSPSAQTAAATQTAPAAAPAKPSRVRAEVEAPQKKSPAVLFAAIGGVVLVGVGLVFAFSGKSDKPTDVGKLPETKPSEPVKPPEPVKPKDPTNFDDFLSMTPTEQHDAMLARRVAAGTSVAELEKLFQWVTDPKVAPNAECRAAVDFVIASALKLEPECEWAHAARGDHRVKDLLEACKNECSEAFRMQDPDERVILDRLKTADTNPWADSKEWMKLSGTVERVRARNDKLKQDPRYLAAERKANWVRENQVFKDVELTRIFADPYVIFQEVKKQDVRDTKSVYDDKEGATKEVPIDGTSNPSKVRQNEIWAKKGELFAQRDAIIFTELHRRFRELFADAYKLPELKDKGRMMTGLVMWNRTSFDKLLKEAGHPVSPGIRAFYSPPQQKIFHYLGDESLQELDEIRCADGRVQKGADQVTMHEGTHQLQHEYSACYRGNPLSDTETKVEDRKAMWFEEGLAEFMGSCEVPEGTTEFLKDVKWFHNRILLERIRESRQNLEHVEKWKIKDFLKPNHNGELQTLGEKLSPNHGGMPSHFYCRVWAFCHFLWYYDNGKYKQAFLDYFKEVMNGTQSSDKFAKIMRRKSVNDWGDIEMEYEWYWTQLLERKVGKNKVTNQWERPSTEPPTGKAQDDEGFVSYWQDKIKEEKEKK
jgi:hypothetical protein